MTYGDDISQWRIFMTVFNDIYSWHRFMTYVQCTNYNGAMMTYRSWHVMMTYLMTYHDDTSHDICCHDISRWHIAWHMLSWHITMTYRMTYTSWHITMTYLMTYVVMTYPMTYDFHRFLYVMRWCPCGVESKPYVMRYVIEVPVMRTCHQHVSLHMSLCVISCCEAGRSHDISKFDMSWRQTFMTYPDDTWYVIRICHGGFFFTDAQ